MSEVVYADWVGEYQVYHTGEVAITELMNAPDRPPWNARYTLDDKYNPSINSLMDSSAIENPASEAPDWEPRELTGSDAEFGVLYTPMNTSAYSRFGRLGGVLGTANLSGCVAIAAARRDEAVTASVSHYDPEAVRQTNGELLKISGLLAAFAGGQAVRAAVAYPRVLSPERRDGMPCSPEDNPIEAIIEGCKKLPVGSQVLLVPYNTKRNTTDPAQANNIYVGDGAGIIHFGWNGYSLDTLSEPEVVDTEQRNFAMESLAHTLAQDDDGYVFE